MMIACVDLEEQVQMGASRRLENTARFSLFVNWQILNGTYVKNELLIHKYFPSSVGDGDKTSLCKE